MHGPWCHVAVGLVILEGSVVLWLGFFVLGNIVRGRREERERQAARRRYGCDSPFLR